MRLVFYNKELKDHVTLSYMRKKLNDFMQTSKLIVQNLLSTKSPLIMGILNVTPDSFSDGGKYFHFEDAINHAKKLIQDGVDIIDIGGESTRPGATFVSEEEELARIMPTLKALLKVRCQVKKHETRNTKHEAQKQFNPASCFLPLASSFLISIDTYKSNVARLALETGADMINDVSGLTKDPDMVKVAAEFNFPIVIMHNSGIPATKPSGDDCRGGSPTRPANVIHETCCWLEKQSQFAISNGVNRENIIIDPGIGFGKTAEEDFTLIENLKEFKSLGFPILVGLSRKSFIRKLFIENSSGLRAQSSEKNLSSQLSAISSKIIELAVKNGADIVRVHENQSVLMDYLYLKLFTF